jgi:hypothetical protein
VGQGAIVKGLTPDRKNIGEFKMRTDVLLKYETSARVEAEIA